MAKKSLNKVTVAIDENIARWVATYERDGIVNAYVVTDWSVNSFGEKPELVEEVDELFALNFLFFYSSQKAQRTAETKPESVPASA